MKYLQSRREAKFLRHYRGYVNDWVDRIERHPAAVVLIHRDAVHYAWAKTGPRIPSPEIAGYEVFALDYIADRMGMQNGEITPHLAMQGAAMQRLGRTREGTPLALSIHLDNQTRREYGLPTDTG